VKNAQDSIKKAIQDQLGPLIDQAKGMIDQVKNTVNDYKKKFEDIKKQVEDTIDKYGGKWIKAGLYIKEHGENAYKAGKAVFDGIKKGIDLLKEKKWEEAGKEVDPAQKNFETAKTEAKP